MSPPNWPGQEVPQSTTGTAPSSTSMPTLRPVLTLPNTDQQHDNAVQDAQLGLSETQTGLSVQNSQREAGNSAFQHAQGLKQDYNHEPAVRAYTESLPMFVSALHTAPNGAGDLLLITAYAKLTDPTTGVREGETANAQAASPYVQQKIAELQGQLDASGGKFPNDVRERYRRELLGLMKQRNEAYNQQRLRYKADAQAFGVEPERVIGPHVGSGSQSDIVKHFNPSEDAKSPEMRGGVPIGSDIQFNMDKGPDGPFNRDDYLKKTYGLTRDQENLAVSFWNANRGNANLTPQAVTKWYKDNGLTPPQGDGLQASIAAAKAGKEFTGIDTSDVEKAYTDRLQAELNKRGFDPKSRGAYSDRVGAGALLGFQDEIEGVKGAADALLNNQGVGDGYTFNRDVARLGQQQERQQQGLLGNGLEFGGGLATGALIPGGPVRAGMTGGALAGFGYGEGLQDSVANAGIGALTGAGLGAAFQGGANAAAARRVQQQLNPSEGAQVIQAADNLNTSLGTNIRPIPADVGGAGTRNLTAGAAKLPLSAAPIVKGAQNVNTEAQAARDALANLAGNPTELETAGESALNGALKYINSSRSKVGALYTKARQQGGSEPVDLANARQALDQQIAELSQVPGGAPGLEKLQALRAQLDKPYPVEGVRGMRTNLRDQFASDGLRGSDIERRVGLVTDAAEQDIVDSLNAAGKPLAAKAYADAAAAHKDRIEVIDNVLAPIIGAKGSAPKSGEEIMSAINSATQRNNARLGKFLGSLPPEDASSVRATLIANLGRSSKGTQNAAGDAFSLPQFLTQWNAMTPGAKRSLFGGELRSALDDLAKVAEGTKQAQAFANHSNTGAPMGMLATGGIATQLSSHPIATVSMLAAQYGGGKLLASPRMARWIAGVPSNPRALQAYSEKLTRIAAADSTIAADALGLQRQLQHVFASGPQSVAANPVPRPGGEERSRKEQLAQ